ncbi:MAG: hypothetical protein JWN49_484, partial [Parcubacteria group bacterium]|nr:hypothetical protein [Parcubacteria group bacterium]
MESEKPVTRGPEGISAGNQNYSFIKNQLMGGEVFVSGDKALYLRTGTQEQIAHEVDLSYELYKRGFPVPEVVEYGQLPNGKFFYTEKAIGDKVFGDIFMDETKEHGHVSDESFEIFNSVMVKYAEAQFDKRNALDIPHSLDEIISLQNVLRNNPPADQEAFDTAYAKAATKIKDLPWTHVQGDLNAFNILDGGVIDFELSGHGPAGYDVIGNVYFGTMWPKERIAYVFTDEQIANYIQRIDEVAQKNGLPSKREYQEDYLMLKLIWSTMKDKDSEDNPEKHTEFWRWRTNVRDWATKRYLAGE